jgi:ubiquinol-cytochrome c reductase cytochrome b subunit
VNIRNWLRDRMAGASAPATVPTVSFAYVAGWVLVMLLAIEGITGAALAAFYAPTTTDAWASVAYVQDQMSAGWLIRGLHHHGASALVIVAGVHLAQTALYGAYKKPRELVWWIGIVLLLLVLAFAITGYVLRWDQAGYWANQVEIGIAAGTPVIGQTIKTLLIGGNDYGNLTLTRFYALHVVVLPAIVTLLVVGHIVLSRRHDATPHWSRTAATGVARWPHQTFRNAVAMAVAFAILLAYTVTTHGVDLAPPADPSSAFDARPLWYFRWLFALRAMAGSAEQIVAMVLPAIVIGGLVALPVLDRGAARNPSRRSLALGGVAGLFALIGALTVVSLVQDSGDAALAKRQQASAQIASRLRAVAAKNGVPVAGPSGLLATQPFYRARTLYAQYCESCHAGDSTDRKGPVIGPGHGNRVWLRGFLKQPSGDIYWGKTKLSKTEETMKPVEAADAEIDQLVEALYSESGARDVDVAKRDLGRTIFGNACVDCHSLEEGAGGGSGPGLGKLKSRAWYLSFISNPKSAQHMTDGKSEMPRFDGELSLVDRDLLAEYLVWLRTATQQDLDKLGPP